jgi:hypothetical protein
MHAIPPLNMPSPAIQDLTQSDHPTAGRPTPPPSPAPPLAEPEVPPAPAELPYPYSGA